jgi:hypothetical protein
VKYTPTITNAEDFAKSWWGWWIDINPAWQEKQQPMKRVQEESWVCLDYHGQNGFLNVLACLKWWRDSLESRSSDWEEAVDDVTWVLQKMQE